MPVIEDAVPEAYRAEAAARAQSRVAAAAETTVLPVIRAAVPPPAGAPATVPPPAEPPASTGWTVAIPVAIPVALPAVADAAAVTTASIGAGLRGRILVVEGGYGAGRRGWSRGSGQGPVLSAMLAAVSPQTLLAADAVDAVHLPSASDPQTVLAHLRAAARHPGPLLVHLGGHLVVDRRGGGLHLTLRDSKPGTVRQDGLAWQAVAAELRARPAEWDTLVIADLSADQSAWPILTAEPAQLVDGLPLWAVIAPDAEQIGTFTRALIETLHGGRPGAGPVLAPEQLRAQVHSVLRPDMLVFAAYGPDRPVFRNTARQRVGDGGAAAQAAPAAPGDVRPAVTDRVPDWVVADAPPVDQPPVVPVMDLPPTDLRPVEVPPAAARPVVERAAVTLRKAGVPPTPPKPIHPVSLAKPADEPVAPEPAEAEPPAPELPVDEPAAVEPPQEPAAVEPEPEPAAVEPEPEPVAVVPEPESAAVEPAVEPAVVPEPAAPPADYREALARIARSADAGEHAAAAELALELEREAVAVHGSVAAPVLMVRQVRAHLARLAGDPAAAAELYREVALVLLAAQGPDDPEAQRAATNAEACWRAVADPRTAIGIAPEILELRAQLPGPDGRKLRAAERYLAGLTAAASGGPASAAAAEAR